MTLRVRQEILLPYLSMAPLPLAFERSLEGAICARLAFERPVLDIGCGEGLFAKMVFDDRIDTGIDPNARELKRAAELGAYDELIECKGDAIPKPDGSYRTIFSNSVLEHIPDLEPVLREAHRLLAPGGRFYMTVPTDKFERFSVLSQLLSACGLAGADARFRRGYNAFWKHYHCYPPAEWQALASRAGFKVLECTTYDPKSVCLMNDALVPFSAIGFVMKRLTNRWTLLPALRRIVMAPVAAGIRSLLRDGSRVENGGLVFLSLSRGDAR